MNHWPRHHRVRRRRRARAPATPPPLLIAVHGYHGDGIYDHKGRDRCAICRLDRNRGRGAQVHTLPPQTAAVDAAEARRFGETDHA